MEEATGRIFKIERGCTHDGPGIRTVVYLKGCPLRCGWCANIEGVDPGYTVLYDAARCVDCGRCIKVCPNGSIRQIRARIREHDCLGYGCGKCVSVCPGGALSGAGRRMTVDEVMGIIRADYPYHLESGGGVTFSGGEPLMQPEFLKAVLVRAKRSQVDTALETSGYAAAETVAELLPHLDHVMMDLKHMDPALHERYTSVPNGPILQNARYIATHCKDMAVNLPLIPGVNDDEGNLRALGRFVRDELKTVRLIRLLPYHNYGEVKYERMGLAYAYRSAEKHTLEKLEEVKATLGEYVERVQLRA